MPSALRRTRRASIGGWAHRSGHTGTVPAPPSDAPRPRSSLRYQLTVTAALVIAFGALIIAIRATETDDPGVVRTSGRPDVIEQVSPRANAEALQQQEVGIDLAPGYEGALILNGTTIPTEQLRLVPEQNQVFFAPGPDRAFASLPSGRNCVTAIVWRSAEGRGTASDLTFSWCFDVT